MNRVGMAWLVTLVMCAFCFLTDLHAQPTPTCDLNGNWNLRIDGQKCLTPWGTTATTCAPYSLTLPEVPFTFHTNGALRGNAPAPEDQNYFYQFFSVTPAISEFTGEWNFPIFRIPECGGTFTGSTGGFFAGTIAADCNTMVFSLDHDIHIVAGGLVEPCNEARELEFVETTVMATRASGPDCRDQAQVIEYNADVEEGLRVIVKEGAYVDLIDLRTDSNGIPGIKFKAVVRISESPLPVDTIHLQYIQNLREFTGTQQYNPPPDLIASLEDGANLPLVDRCTRGCPSTPPFPYYNADFEETNPTGPERTVTAADSPHIPSGDPRPIQWGMRVFGIPHPPWLYPQELEGIDVTESFTTYLGCYTDADPVFRTLATLDWRAHFVGTFKPGNPPEFIPGSNAGIFIQKTAIGGGVPVQTVPVAIDVITFVEEE